MSKAHIPSAIAIRGCSSTVREKTKLLNVSEKTLKKNVHRCYIGVTEGNTEKKNGKMSLNIFIFIYTIHLAYLKVYTNFDNPKSSLC